MVGLPDGEKIEYICNPLGTIPACDGQTDRQTAGHLATAYTRYAYASRSKNGSTAIAGRLNFVDITLL